MFLPSFHAPFGSCATDLDFRSLLSREDREPRPLSLSQFASVDRFRALGVVTKHFTSAGAAERAWKIMSLAGDCSVSVVGRLFHDGRVVGLCMPLETLLDTPNIGTKGERVRIIHQLRDLVAELHSKGIIHGDLKPQNLLICSDGRLRLCDFDEASVEGDGFTSDRITAPYCSTVRARDSTLPVTRAEDMHAMALTMWEIYTGRIPLLEDNETLEECDGDLLDRCLLGLLPDMQLIDDPDIASLISSCLAAGPDRPDTWNTSGFYCVRTRFVFGRCKAEPRHTYSRIIHSVRCILRADRGEGPCEPEYRVDDPKVFTSPLEPICTRCNRGVEYIGLT
ncbi:kinase-like domain-containing protein [Mycena galericulata]|nr:kinase-like domain-containing protein [Mycena galericulata]